MADPQKCLSCNHPFNPRHYRAELPGIGSMEFKLTAPLDGQGIQFTKRFFDLVLDSMTRESADWKEAQKGDSH